MGGILSPPDPGTPPPPPPIPPAAIPPTMANATVQQAGQNQKNKAAAFADSTVKTSAEGDLVKPSTTSSQLLG
jgi:hypothetical protein